MILGASSDLNKINSSSSDPIDFVIIWVDGNDAEWRKEKARYSENTNDFSDCEVRYRDWDNLQYWFRGVEKFAPWVNKIHFVTWGHLPPWLDTGNPRLHIVNHKDYIPKEYLPTFSSHTIELNLHRIEGLSERFVYFNDDMFITAPTVPTDFFVNGKPCDTFALDCIYFKTDSAGFYNGSDLTVINDNFDKKVSLRNNLSKCYSPKNGIRNVVRTLCLSPWKYFPGFYYQHLANSFLKSTFEEVWDKANNTLDLTCRDKFRKPSNVNQWLMKFWQLASGNFEVRDDGFCYCYHIKEENFPALLDDIPSQKYRMMCINDTSETLNFEMKKEMVQKAFEKLLPEKSSFEI
ncbi:MAG: Stealth CR1 domain-containing protein [Lachnospiraceae bacterium]|nr:Stealth CR1 domain-containing protein [Lachnospiraceae bacterium]